MIRVNLLREQTARVRKTVVRPEVSRTGVMLLAVLLVLAAVLGGWWWTVTRQVARLRAQRDDLKAQSAALEGLKKQIAAFEKKKALQQGRIEVIEKLKEQQTGPVMLLNHVIQSMPGEDGVWLTQLDQKGDRVQIRGYVVRGEAIPGFLSNLARSGVFRTVDLEAMEDEKVASRFSFICTLARKGPVE
jgi:Tfp pilus assembly protein PilN